MKQGLVSIVMPAYNAERFIDQAVESVINQSYDQWELIIVNDCSSDSTLQKIQSFVHDPRIKVLDNPKNLGVSSSRNKAIEQAKGEFLCFLDADDLLPENSLQNRIDAFNANSELEFVDGTIEIIDEFNQIKESRVLSFSGNPFKALLSLDGSCFVTITWMIRLKEEKKYAFKEGLTHGEDLLFFLSISETGIYKSIHNPTYRYRKTGTSAMNNLDGLARGYENLFQELKMWDNISPSLLHQFRNNYRLIMLKSFLKEGQIWKAISFWMR